MGLFLTLGYNNISETDVLVCEIGFYSILLHILVYIKICALIAGPGQQPFIFFTLAAQLSRAT